MNFTIHQATHIGNRKYNQDRVAHAYTEHCLMLVLADGMGGHLHGEQAAEIAIDTFVESFEQYSTQQKLSDPQAFLSKTMECAHKRILQLPHPDTNSQPGTTCVAALVTDNTLYFGHAGDSRLYLFRNAQTVVHTEDHSLVNLWVKQGVIKPAEAHTHPMRNQITNCLGGANHDFFMEPGTVTGLNPQDTILLGSDGLWAMFYNKELAKGLQQPPLETTLQQLIKEAVERAEGHADNTTGLAMCWQPQPPEQPTNNTEQPVINILWIP